MAAHGLLHASLRHVATFLGASSTDFALPLLLVHLNIVVYAGAFWMQQPVLPYLSEALGADEVVFGLLVSTISALALLGLPFLGWLTDTHGAKRSIIVSQMASVVMYGLMWRAHSLPWLFASRIPAALQHCMLCAQAAVSRMSARENRAQALGRISLSYGVGMVLGGPVGGALATRYGHHSSALAAFLLSLLVTLLDALFLPNSLNQRSETAAEEGKEEGGTDAGAVKPEAPASGDASESESESVKAHWTKLFFAPAVRSMMLFGFLLR